VIEVHVAAVALVPDARDPYLRLVHVLRAEAGGVEHGLRGASALLLGDARAELVELLGHRARILLRSLERERRWRGAGAQLGVEAGRGGQPDPRHGEEGD